MLEGDRPDASSPSRAPRASLKSPVDRPRRYSTGSTSSTFGDRRMYGGRIELVKRCPDLRLSTRGACTSTVPAPVVTWRAQAWPLRTTRTRPSSPRSARCLSTYSETSASKASISIPACVLAGEIVEGDRQLPLYAVGFDYPWGIIRECRWHAGALLCNPPNL